MPRDKRPQGSVPSQRKRASETSAEVSTANSIPKPGAASAKVEKAVKPASKPELSAGSPSKVTLKGKPAVDKKTAVCASKKISNEAIPAAEATSQAKTSLVGSMRTPNAAPKTLPPAKAIAGAKARVGATKKKPAKPEQAGLAQPPLVDHELIASVDPLMIEAIPETESATETTSSLAEFDFLLRSIEAVPQAEAAIEPELPAPGVIPMELAAETVEPVLQPAIEIQNLTPSLEAVSIPGPAAIELEPATNAVSTQSVAGEFVERRVADKPLIERRLKDPSARNRRKTDFSAKPLAEPAANVEVGSEAEKLPPIPEPPAHREDPVQSAKYDGVDRRKSVDRRETFLRDDLRSREQHQRVTETALWMRKGGAVLIGLNLLTVIAVIILGRVHFSQLQEMQRATAASAEAAYAACLGTQTARNVLMEMKAERAQPRPLGRSEVLQTIAARQLQPTQIAFDLDKTASINSHIPVLFHFKVENTGDSPALNAKVWGVVKILDSGKEPDFSYNEVLLSKATILPRDPAKVISYTENNGLVAPLSDSDFQRITSGSEYVVAYGRATYQDATGVWHWAQFCEEIGQPAGTKNRSSKCSAYNSSDDHGHTQGAPMQQASSVQPGLQNAAMSFPEIACEVPKSQKNY